MRALLRLILVLILAAGTIGRPALDAQVRPVYDLGAAGLSQVLERLQTTASALHTGAHPDDEDSAFMARTGRGDHARVAYLSLNRGEGGQNIIGTELFDALGVIRTEELLQARTLDGGAQFFTRTFDYGFSKTRAEAAGKWNERDVLGDMVRVIRMFRPLVINARFAGTPADGHGHHQLAGYLTPLAFRAAANPAEFPEHLAEGLRPWQAKKLYRTVGFRPDPANAATIEVQTGLIAPFIGRSYAEIAAEGRSQHKSQAMGTLELRGPSASGLRLIESVVPLAPVERSVFDGLDTSVPGLAALAGLPAGTLRMELQSIADAARQVLERYAPLEAARIVPQLAAGLRATRVARAALTSTAGSADARADADFLLSFKEADFVDALTRAAGLVVDPLADDETVVQGATVGVTIRTFAANPATVKDAAASVIAPTGWTVTPVAERADESPFGRREAAAHSARFRVTVPAEAPLTEPYFLAQPRETDRYRWPEGRPKGLPFDPPLLTARVRVEIGGVTVDVNQPVRYRFADPVRGELRRDVHVVPAVTVGLDSRQLVVPLGATPVTRRVVVRAMSFSAQPVNGTLRLRLPQGWTATPGEAAFVLRARGDKTSSVFVVTAPAGRRAGSLSLAAEAVVGGATFSRDVQTIAYPHIQTHRMYWPATATVQVLDLKVAAVQVGYVMGSGDQVPEALRRLGVDVTLIDDETLAAGDLSRFDTIVVGVRASEARPEFVANNNRLLQYVERGGTLIVQYQQTDYVTRNMPPFPVASPANTRVTDEAAPVTILAPEHPVFTFPNRITGADFGGWVQERNLYAFNMSDTRYTPLLESADAGEPPQRGGEVYAELGKGRYVYTAYSWFRQLPAGVPGAYRQVANLISLAKAPRRADAPGRGAAPRTGAATAPAADGGTRPTR